MRVSRQTIYNWAARFIATVDPPMPERLSDAARSRRPPIALEIDEVMYNRSFLKKCVATFCLDVYADSHFI
jgi:hypothetical protein